MGEKYKINIGIIALSISPMLGHYIDSSVGFSLFIYGVSMIAWGTAEFSL